jgi:hypothetical protein
MTVEMFDEQIATLIKADGTPEQKKWLAEDALQAEEAEAAVADLVRSWRQFKESGGVHLSGLPSPTRGSRTSFAVATARRVASGSTTSTGSS